MAARLSLEFSNVVLVEHRCPSGNALSFLERFEPIGEPFVKNSHRILALYSRDDADLIESTAHPRCDIDGDAAREKRYVD